MPRNGDSRQASAREFVAIKKVPGGTVDRQRPGINPDGVREIWGLGRIINIRFAREKVLLRAVRTVCIEIAIESVASLVVGPVACDQPGPRYPPLRRGVLLQLGWGAFRRRRTGPHFVDRRITDLEPEHP